MRPSLISRPGEAKEAELVADYKAKFANPYKAAEMGYIDDVIEPHETRSRLVSAPMAARNKREARPSRKHGNIPVWYGGGVMCSMQVRKAE